MKRLNLLVASIAFLLAGGTTPAASDSAGSAGSLVDVTGTWDLAVVFDGGSGNPVFTFHQEGGKLTGTYQGAFGEAPVTGTMEGSAIRFTFKVSPEGQEVTITYTGTVEGSAMKGKVQLGGYGDGSFTGKKRTAPAPA
jgi:hypothetical protein